MRWVKLGLALVNPLVRWPQVVLYILFVGPHLLRAMKALLDPAGTVLVGVLVPPVLWDRSLGAEHPLWLSLVDQPRVP